MRDGRLSHCKRCSTDASNEITRNMRLKVVASLGGKCVWEGCSVDDTDMLTIDHVRGGGGVDRKDKNPYTYYKAMLDSPSDFQVLCWNHNHKKRMTLGEHRKRAI
jgi:hypothetical protein